jgi:hypothetical protein
VIPIPGLQTDRTAAPESTTTRPKTPTRPTRPPKN